MYTRKIYEPEKKLLLQIPGHGTASVGGNTQQQVYTRASQTRKTSDTLIGEIVSHQGYERKIGNRQTEARSGSGRDSNGAYTAVPLENPYSIQDKYGAAIGDALSDTYQTLQQRIKDSREQLDSLNEQRQALPVQNESTVPDLALLIFGGGSAAPSKEMKEQAFALDNQILETENKLIQYQDELLHMDIGALYGQEGVEGWDAYIRYTQERERTEAERLENETWQDKLGRYMSGNTRDTTLPFYIDEQEMAEGYRTQERGKREPDDRWTNGQKADLGFLWGSSPQMAGDYAMLLNKRLDAGEEAQQIELIQEWATRNPFNATLATAGAIVASPVGGMADYLNDMMAYGTLGYIPETDGTVDPWEFSQTVTSGISEEMNSWGTIPEAVPVIGGKGFGDAYSLDTTVLQSTLAAVTGGPGQAIVTFIGPAAAAAKDDALRRGADDDKALIYGGIVGLIEAGTEAIGSGNIVRLFSSGGLKALFSSAGMGEALEEAVASLASFLADVLIFREDSVFANRVAEYREGGATKLEAVAGAAWDTLEDVLYDSLAGGLSGEIHAGMARAWDAVSNALGDSDAAYRPGDRSARNEAGYTPARSTPNIGAALTDAGVRGLSALANPQTLENGGTLMNPGSVGTEKLLTHQAQTSLTTQTDTASLTADAWTNNLDGLWTENADMQMDMNAETVPIRYEDALRQYLEEDAMLSAGDIHSNANLNVDMVPDGETVPKSKEQIISEPAPKIRTPGMTSGRAVIPAQEMYSEAEKNFGPDADIAMEAYQPGQNPRQFLDGFRNAYIAGKMGSRAALENSTAATYLTEEQRNLAFDLGTENIPQGKSMPAEMSSADIRDRLEAITIRGTTKLPQGFSAFPEGDVLNGRIKKVKPDGDKFDVAMHGSPTAVAFGGSEANMSPHLLAEIIRHSEGYHGQDVRLLSCSTGMTVDGAYCFAEELANALGVTVWAPNDLLFVSPNGIISIGKGNRGRMIPYEPNERGRIK